MGLFDFFKGKSGGAVDERALMRHAERVMDKRAMSPDRFGSIEFLCRSGSPEAWRALLPRFNFNVDPSITDREEKQFIYEAIAGLEGEQKEHAIEPVKEYLRAAATLSWPIKMLRSLVDREELVAELVDFLQTFDTGYEKNSERKAQIVAALEEEPDPHVTPAVLPFLEDFNEDVRFHAVRTLAAQSDETARSPLVKLLLRDDSVRIRSTVVDGLAERAWPIDPADRDAVSRLLPSIPTGPWLLDADGRIVRSTR